MSRAVCARAADGAFKAVVRLSALQMVPAVTVFPRVRRTWPRLAGITNDDHVALTFDDGPDDSTPAFLDLLEGHGVSATFFVLGRHVSGQAEVLRRMQDAGHEVGVHGWDHRCLALRRPGTLYTDLRRTVDLVEGLTGARPRHYRPPYGVLTLEGLVAAARLGLHPVLWSASGRDWSSAATPESIVAGVESSRTRGGTVLLHDSDRISRGGSWRHTHAATALLLDRWHAAGLRVGSLADHGRPRPA